MACASTSSAQGAVETPILDRLQNPTFRRRKASLCPAAELPRCRSAEADRRRSPLRPARLEGDRTRPSHHRRPGGGPIPLVRPPALSGAHRQDHEAAGPTRCTTATSASSPAPREGTGHRPRRGPGTGVIFAALDGIAPAATGLRRRDDDQRLRRGPAKDPRRPAPGERRATEKSSAATQDRRGHSGFVATTWTSSIRCSAMLWASPCIRASKLGIRGARASALGRAAAETGRRRR